MLSCYFISLCIEVARYDCTRLRAGETWMILIFTAEFFEYEGRAEEDKGVDRG